MSQNVVFNGSEVALEVDIERGTEKAAVFIQPKGRVTLEEGFYVSSLYSQLNPQVRQVSRVDYDAQKTLLTSKASYFAPATNTTAAVTNTASPTAYKSEPSSDTQASSTNKQTK